MNEFRSLVSSAHEQQTLGCSQNAKSERLQRLILVQHLFDLCWKLMQAIDNLVPSGGEGNAIFGKLKSHHQEGDILRGICLD